jgi:hypothetical protein
LAFGKISHHKWFRITILPIYSLQMTNSCLYDHFVVHALYYSVQAPYKLLLFCTYVVVMLHVTEKENNNRCWVIKLLNLHQNWNDAHETLVVTCYFSIQLLNFVNAIYRQLAYFFRQIARFTHVRLSCEQSWNLNFTNKSCHVETKDVQKVWQLCRETALTLQ